jgi:hypothetical protein
MASVVTLLSGYPLWAGRNAIRTVVTTSKFVPTLAEIKPLLESEVRTHRYAAQWEQGAQQAMLEGQKQITGPVTPRPTYDELKAKYGENWGITNPDRKPKTTAEQCRQKLIDMVGQAAYDAIPDQGYDQDSWQKLHPSITEEASE